MQELGSGAFAHSAFRMLELGLAPIPTLGPQGKTPVLKGYTAGIVNPGNVLEIAQKFPTANLALVCGPSRLAVLDIDDASLLDRMILRFGNSPLKVRTGGRGGFQIYYRSSSSIRPRDFRSTEGIPVEIKAQGNIVVAPPSRNFETGRAYELIAGCFEEEIISQLPELRSDNADCTHSAARIEQGEREKWIFSECLKNSPYCDSFADLLDYAQTRNDECTPQLDRREVHHAARCAWSYQITGRNFAASRGGVVLTRADIDVICSLCPGDPLALVLRLRLDHSARCARGETFALATVAMAMANVIPGWSRQNYRTGIAKALARGWLEYADNSAVPRLYRLGAITNVMV